jgi:DNA-binding NtrC family response regulator
MAPPPDDVKTALQDRPPALPRTAFLVTITEGPDRGRTFRLDGASPPRVLVGQSPTCEVRLSDLHVSRRHAAFDLAGGNLRLTDLGSTNGTTIGGVGVVEALLRGGETIRLGDTLLRVDLVEDADPMPLSAATHFGRTLGASVEMRRTYRLCDRLAASDVPILIEGETGTGKEVLAESIHEASRRSAGPFVVFDCTAVPPSLIESELFGHERGAFTGAVDARKGVFEEADGGTLLIDEIGDLDRTLQPKLLRALERGEVRRVGGKTIKVDVRVLAATRRDLDRAVQMGAFRDDLFFRLAVARIELPPLRDRRGDIELLTRHFWQAMGGPSEIPFEVLSRFESYSWPGNVRELHNAVARQIALGEAFDAAARATTTTTTSGRDAIEEVLALDLPFPRARDRVLHEFETRYVSRALAQHGGVAAHAAAASGIARRYFYQIRARTRT